MRAVGKFASLRAPAATAILKSDNPSIAPVNNGNES